MEFLNVILEIVKTISVGNIDFNCGGCPRIGDGYVCTTYPSPKAIMKFSYSPFEERDGKTIRGCHFNSQKFRPEVTTAQQKKRVGQQKQKKKKH